MSTSKIPVHVHSACLYRTAAACLALFALTACGGGGGGGSGGGSTPTTYTLGATVSGLGSGARVTLQDNGGNDLAVSANGSVTFTTALASGAAYAVTVKTQPTSPSQTCTVGNGSGNVGSANVTTVTVTCTTNTYSVSVNVTGLSGSGLVLQDNGGDDLAVSGNGPVSFATALASGAAYAVTVKAQPASAQTCTLTNGTGTVGSANVTAVAVTCTSATPTIAVHVVGAGSAVSGATVSLYATGTASTLLTTGTTDSSGQVSLVYACPAAGTLIYVSAEGGSVGSAGPNPYNDMVSALGACGGLPATVVVNELTTATAAYTLNGFTTVSVTTSATTVTIAGKSPGLDNAFLTFANIMDPATGQEAISGNVTNAGSALAVLDTVADAMAACNGSSANTTTTASSACSQLFTCAIQNATYTSGPSCTVPTGSNTIADIYLAAISIVRNAGLVSMNGLYNLAAPNTIFTPAFTAAPTDFELLLAFSAPDIGPQIAIDDAGNVWSMQNNTTPGLLEIDPRGNLLSGATGFTGGGVLNTSLLFGAGGEQTTLAIDASGNIWVGGTGLAQFNSAGQMVGMPLTNTQLTTGLQAGTQSMAIDSMGNIWMSPSNCCDQPSSNNPVLVEVNAAGSVVSGALGYQFNNTLPGGAGGGGGVYEGISIDASGNVWIANGDDLDEVNNAGTQIGDYAPVPIACCTYSPYFHSTAVNPNGSIWGGDNFDNAVAFLDPSHSFASYGPYTGGGINGPNALAMDANGHVWVANNNGTIAMLNSNGSPLSPSVGYASGYVPLQGTALFGIAVDASGNVWASGNQTLYELVGAAAPTKTPLVSAVNQGFTP